MTLTEQAKALHDLLHSDFCESDESMQLEAIYCELENTYNMGFKAGQLLITDNWIPVSERLPEKFQPVLIHLTNGEVNKGQINGYGKWECLDYYRISTPLHWMPFPEPPTDSATGEDDDTD